MMLALAVSAPVVALSDVRSNRGDVVQLYCRQTVEHPGQPYGIFTLTRASDGTYEAAGTLNGAKEKPRTLIQDLKCEFDADETYLFVCAGTGTSAYSEKVQRTRIPTPGAPKRLLSPELTVQVLGISRADDTFTLHLLFTRDCEEKK